MLFTISIDTEADCSLDWTGASPESYLNISALKNKLLPILNQQGCVATLLLNADIIQRESPSKICEDLYCKEGWELGTHLHGELVEPLLKYTSPAGIGLVICNASIQPKLSLKKWRI